MSVIGSATSFTDLAGLADVAEEAEHASLPWRLKFAAAAVGAESLLVYNALLTTQTFFAYEAFKGLGFAFTSMLFYSGPMCVCQAFMIFKGDSYSLISRMRFGFIGVFTADVALIVVAVVVSDSNKIEMYCFCLCAIVLLSITGAVMQSGLMGYCAALSPQASAAAMQGFGVCGLMTFGFGELFLIVGFKANVQTYLLFFLCLGYTLFSWVINERLLLRGSAREALMQNVPNGMRPSESQASQMASMDVAALAGSARAGQEVMDTKSVLRAIFPQALNVFLVFGISLSMFPGVVVAWKVDEHSIFTDQAALTTLLVGMFQLFDVVGRYIAGATARCINPKTVIWLVLLRLAFIPVFMLGQRSPGGSWLWGSDLGRCLLMMLFAGTNGYLGSLAMMFGPELVSKENRSVAGIAMSTSMVWGLFFGCLVAPASQIGVPRTP